MTILRTELLHWLNDTLHPERFRDYCPNGLQLEGRETIRHIITGVTASQALIDAAAERGADTVLVHHGWFWKNEDPCVRGMKRRRLARALQANLNLLAYHLPLDAHPMLGNNAQLARVLELKPHHGEDGQPLTCGPENLVWLGQLPQPVSLGTLASRIEHRLARTPLLVGDPAKTVHTIAWCTGAAQGMIDAAVAAGADVYLSGEISEPTFHAATENDIAYVAAGHHATERYGVQALGNAIAQHFGITVEFLDIDNPA
jgi:dinuclear metal center YbgI/SA1388 family protein